MVILLYWNTGLLFLQQTVSVLSTEFKELSFIIIVVTFLFCFTAW